MGRVNGAVGNVNATLRLVACKSLTLLAAVGYYPLQKIVTGGQYSKASTVSRFEHKSRFTPLNISSGLYENKFYLYLSS